MRFFTRLLLTVLSLLAMSCSSIQIRIHNEAWRPSSTAKSRPDDPALPVQDVIASFKEDNQASVEIVEGRYSLYICEFDDAGIAHNPGAIDKALAALRSTLAPGEPPALILTFAHGWKNNAAADNANLQIFRYALLDTARLENKAAEDAVRPPRPVIGFYIAWRGDLTEVPVVRELTVWSRKASAGRVGGIGAPEVITQIRNLYVERRTKEDEASEKALARGEPMPLTTRSVAIGHSFGTVVMGECYLPWLTGYLSDPLHASRPADLVVLINPAYEALRIFPLMEHIQRHGPGDRSLPTILAVLQSKGDFPTRKLFPISRLLLPLVRTYRGDQASLNRTALGHYGPYRTHTLHLDSKRPKDPEASREKAAAGRHGLGEASFRFDQKRTKVSGQDIVYFKEVNGPYSNTGLVRNVYVDESIIEAHGLPKPPDGSSDPGGSYEALIAAIQVLLKDIEEKQTLEKMRKATSTRPVGSLKSSPGSESLPAATPGPKPLAIPSPAKAPAPAATAQPGTLEIR